MQLIVALLGVHALIRREGSEGLSPIPRDDVSQRCEHRVFQVKVPSVTWERLKQMGSNLEKLIGDRALSIDRDRNKVKKYATAIKLFKATEQFQRLEKVTEGTLKGKVVPFVNLEPLKEEANVWSWFASEKVGGQQLILEDFLRGFLGDDYEKVADLVEVLKWGKDGNVHLDVPSKGIGLTMWLLLPQTFAERLDASATNNVKMRFSLVQILGQEALVEAVAETTKKTRVKDVFQSNHFQDCDKMMMNDLRDFIPTAKDEDSRGRLKDLFGGDDTREKNYECILPPKPYTPEIKQETDDDFRRLIDEAKQVPGGIEGIANKASKYNDALEVSDKSGGIGGFFNNEGYVHGGDVFPRWYFYVMQTCGHTSAWSCPTCQKYNKAPGRWGKFVGADGLKKPPNSYLAIRSQ